MRRSLKPSEKKWFMDQLQICMITSFALFWKPLQKKVNEDKDYAEGEWLTISGWGNTHAVTRENFPATLKVATVPMISQKECEKAYATDNPITQSMFCAGKLHVGGVDSCQGRVQRSRTFIYTPAGGSNHVCTQCPKSHLTRIAVATDRY